MPENRIDSPPASMSSLVGGIISDAQQLIRQELLLARREVQQEVNKAKMAALSLAAGGVTALVRGTVQSAKATVEETIENVRSKVQETVQTVKRTFDLPYQVERHPWAMVGGSVLAGYLAGTFLLPRPGKAERLFGSRIAPAASSAEPA